MNYQRIYNELMKKAAIRGRVEGERHHILPVSLGGADTDDNMVWLTIREHFIAHHLLCKFLTGKDKTRMLFAFGFMSTASKHNQYRKNVNGRLFAESKRAALEAKRVLKDTEGWVSPVRGTKWFTDGERKYRLRECDPKIEILGLTPCEGASKGLAWFFTGIEFKMLKPSEGKALGFVSRSPAHGKPKAFSDAVKKQRAEMKWFNNGTANTKLKPDDPRAIGLKPGRLLNTAALDNIRNAARQTRAKVGATWQKGTKVFNDGQRNIIIPPGEPIPDHLQKGMLRRHHHNSQT